MVSKPIADYAVVPDLHAAVFLVRADKKTRIFSSGRGGCMFTICMNAQVGLVLVPEVVPLKIL